VRVRLYDMPTPVGESDAAARRTANSFPLLRAAHIGPTIAVTTLTALIAVSENLTAYRGVVVTAAVFAGQLTIGWCNDLADAARDRQVGRTDKPLATGELGPSTVLAWLVLAAGACLGLSLVVGWRSAAVHLGLVVGGGHLYNLALKATLWSWLPYAVAFGTLPAVVTLADPSHHWPRLWMMLAAGVLGVAAHVLNALPDHEDDAKTGMQGMPHRLGQRRSRVSATVLLVVASVIAALGPAGRPGETSWAALVAVLALAIVALAGRGRAPFHAAIAIALVDVLLLAVVGA
jgi:4-hydroxybenzoate polyprenyltransferase